MSATQSLPLSEPARMSGGELDGPFKEIYLELRKRIEAEPDVHRLVDLHPVDKSSLDTRWLYLIETPFATFPKFVVGSTDAGNAAPEIHFSAGAEWSAREEWQALLSFS